MTFRLALYGNPLMAAVLLQDCAQAADRGYYGSD